MSLRLFPILALTKEVIMSKLTDFAPLLIGAALTWFVIMGVREIFKEAYFAVMKKTNA